MEFGQGQEGGWEEEKEQEEEEEEAEGARSSRRDVRTCARRDVRPPGRPCLLLSEAGVQQAGVQHGGAAWGCSRGSFLGIADARRART